jgi:peptidoglycan/LPS O-acetylase OafA/YrhL
MSVPLDITGNDHEQEQPTALVEENHKFLPPIDFSRRIPELDGLRGLAIGTVVFAHYLWFAFMAHPSDLMGTVFASTRPLWSAVDLFFVLSGFLIGGNLLDARDSANYFSTFYIRRFCRVLPVYFLFLGAAAATYRFVYRPTSSPMDVFFAGRLPWYAYLTFGQNFWMAKLNNVGPTILAITWAFAVEVQFYLIVPSIIRFARRSALPYLFAAGVALAPIARLLVVYRFRNHLWATYVLLPCRMDSLFLGLLCAYFVRQPGFWKWLDEGRITLRMACLALFAGTPFLNTKGIPFTLLWITIGCGWTSLFYSTVLLLAVTKSSAAIGSVLRARWLTGLGTISYGIYLFHSCVYGICVWLLDQHGDQKTGWQVFGATLLGLAITLCIGKVSWQYFERPIVRWSHRLQYELPLAYERRPARAISAGTERNAADEKATMYLPQPMRQDTLFPAHSIHRKSEVPASEIRFLGRP